MRPALPVLGARASIIISGRTGARGRATAVDVSWTRSRRIVEPAVGAVDFLRTSLYIGQHHLAYDAAPDASGGSARRACRLPSRGRAGEGKWHGTERWA